MWIVVAFRSKCLNLICLTPKGVAFEEAKCLFVFSSPSYCHTL